MTPTHTVEIVLAGGLGNQLFQLAAGICSQDSSLIINDSLTKLTFTEHGMPQALELMEEHNFEISELKANYFRKKFVNIALRICGSNMCSLRKILLSFVLERIGSLLFPGYSLYIERLPKRNSQSSKKSLLIGYFQTPEHIEQNQAKIFNQISHLKLEEINSVEEIEVAVHIRGGDYRLEPKLGLLSQQYYKKSIQELNVNLQFSSLHVFTNDLEYAEEILEGLQYENVILHLAENEDLFQSFYLMSKAENLVISNSSFAWWAGFLGSCQGSKIIFPRPWFKQLKIDNLGLKNWTSEKSSFI